MSQMWLGSGVIVAQVFLYAADAAMKRKKKRHQGCVQTLHFLLLMYWLEKTSMIMAQGKKVSRVGKVGEKGKVCIKAAPTSPDFTPTLSM